MSAPITDHPGLVRALRARRQSLGLSQLAVDHIGGLPDGYMAKVEASLTNPGANNARSIGRESLPKVLEALKCGMVLVSTSRAAKRANLRSADNAMLLVAPEKNFADLGKKGGRKRVRLMSPAKREAHMKKLNLARIQRRRQRAREAKMKAAAQSTVTRTPRTSKDAAPQSNTTPAATAAQASL